MDAMSAKVGAVGKAMTVAGAAITAAFGVIITKTAAVGDKFDKMSKRTGVSVENLSALSYAADISGTSIEAVEKGLKGLTKVMDDASMGIGEGKEAFEELDIAVTDTEGNLRPTMDVLKEAATKIAAIENPTKQAALAMDLFGAKAGPQLLPLLKEGEGGIDGLMEKAKELNAVISTESATASADFTDRMTDLKVIIAGAGRTIGEILIPPLTRFAEKAIEVMKNIKNWADAHKPLLAILVKVAAILGALAAVGGPILLAVAAFMKMKVAIIAVSAVMKAFAATTGPIGIIIAAVGALYLAWETNFGGIRDITAAVVGKITEALGWLWDKVKWVLEKLGLYKESVIETIEPTEDLAEATTKAGDNAETAAPQVDTLTTSIGELETGTDNSKEALDEWGQKIETFGEWCERLAREEADRQTKITAKLKKEADIRKGILEEEAKKRKAALEKLAAAQGAFATSMDAVINKIYEFTHTDYEVTLKNINEEYDNLIEKAKKVFLSESELADAIKTLNEARQLEIDKLKDLDEPQKKVIENTIEMTDKEKDLAAQLALTVEEYAEYKKKIEDAALAAKLAGEAGESSWEGFTTQIKHATAALSTFTAEGVASAVASIKMKFYPALQSAYASLKTAGKYSFLVQGNISHILEMQKEQIAQVMYGFKQYQKTLASMGGSSETPSYAVGTPYVPETGLALIHKGEAVIPANQNTTNNQNYSPSVVVNVSGNGNVAEIKRAVQDALNDSKRQFSRRGFELAPGM